MRSALFCSYQPRHAAPREPLSLETRSVLAVGLAAAMLPLGAAPALADEAPTTATSSSAQEQSQVTAAPAQDAPESPAAGPAAAGPAAESPAPAPAAPASTPASGPVRSAQQAPASEPSPYSVGAAGSDGTAPRATASPSASAPADAAAPSSRRRASTALSFNAPTAARGAAVPVAVRLVSDGKGVRNGYVRLEQATSDGWTFAGRLLTDGEGNGKGTLRVAGATRLRAAYTGSEVRTPAVSRPRTVRAKSVEPTGAVLQEAAKHVGKPYRYGAVGPDSFDCSGFTRYVFGQLGKDLPHNSRAQEQMATPVSKAEARPGDLVFIQDVAGHVGIYAGNGQMYDAPRSGKTVTLRAIWTSNYTVGRV